MLDGFDRKLQAIERQFFFLKAMITAIEQGRQALDIHLIDKSKSYGLMSTTELENLILPFVRWSENTR